MKARDPKRPTCPHCGLALDPEQIAALLGKIGGSATSAAKARTSRENGKKGGRPRKAEKAP
jgi:hypothetical protein